MSKARQRIVTPEQAREWFETNTQKAGVDMAKVDKYVSAMTSGEWSDQAVDPGSEIVLKDGKLLNGCHRCLAIKLTGKPMKMWVREK